MYKCIVSIVITTCTRNIDLRPPPFFVPPRAVSTVVDCYYCTRSSCKIFRVKKKLSEIIVFYFVYSGAIR